MDWTGQSAWLYDGSSTIRLGLLDVDHTRSSDGFHWSYVTHLTDSGYVAGWSRRFGPGDTARARSRGFSTWLYDGSSTTRVGLFDVDHTRSDGDQFSHISHLTDSGYAAGTSNQRTGGRSAWFYDGSSATRIGDFDAVHTRSTDGYQDSDVTRLTESGYAAGYSSRFDGEVSLGQTGWIYDPVADTQISIILSERSDGYAYSYVSFLGEDGLGLGSYVLFDAADANLGGRAFAWTPESGAVDLGALVAGGLSAAGWSALYGAIRENGLDQIVGGGILPTGGWLAYLLVPIPEPGTGVLVALGLLGFAARPRTRHSAATPRKGPGLSPEVHTTEYS